MRDLTAGPPLPTLPLKVVLGLPSPKQSGVLWKCPQLVLYLLFDGAELGVWIGEPKKKEANLGAKVPECYGFRKWSDFFFFLRYKPERLRLIHTNLS